MNRTEHIPRCAEGSGRWIAWLAVVMCLILTMCRVSGAASYYINNAIVSYPGTADSPPQIDATNFVNNSSFTINFDQNELDFSLNQPFYETSDTLNYTNYGTLMINTGFQFDDYSLANGFHYRSSSFFNPGTVSCASVNNPGDPFGGSLGLEGWALCYVNATNIVVNQGTVDVGEDGLIQMLGKNVDLSGSLLTIEAGGVNVTGSGVATLNTNKVFGWDPTLYLTPTNAESAFFPIAPLILYLSNSTSYFDVHQLEGTNIIRCVFVEDFSGSNVSTSVYFDPDLQDQDFGGGTALIQWAGSYLDSASGNTYSNYLYLQDDYLLGASTNVLPIVNVPINFTFFESGGMPLANLPPPAPVQFPDTFPNQFFPGIVTNYYDYANIQFLASASTNDIANQSVTNLPGRVEISGDNYLNLSNAQISGQSYMSLVSSNDFAGSGGAFIQAPYADLNLGKTNGALNITNTMVASLPLWGGTCQAWNTRWVLVDTTLGVTNDYRVLIVGSHLTTTIAAQVQNLILRDYSSNSVLISDTFNVMNSFYTDAQNLTLSTNPIGDGATSLDGELNLESPNIFWQSSTPNLHFLTNNGAIRMQNLAYFGEPVVTNVYGAVAASGTLSETVTGTNAVRKDKVTIGTNQYWFVYTLTNTIANQVAIDPTSFYNTMNHLIDAINGAPGGAGSEYSADTEANPQAAAGPLVGSSFTVVALAGGTAGNSIATSFTPSTSSSNLTWGGHSTLYGGLAPTMTTQSYLTGTALINNGIFMDQGSIFYAGNFESSGIFSNGIGSFMLESLTSTLTNGSFYANGDVSFTASSLVFSNLMLEADRSLTLNITNLLDDGTTNDNFWLVGMDSVGSGINLPIKPVTGDLLDTMVTLIAPTNRSVVNTWAGTDMGLSPAGYTNNEAIGMFTLNVVNPAVPGHNGSLVFNGTGVAGVSNALYVDLLVLTNFATTGNSTNNYNFPWLNINNNMMVYYARAIEMIGGQAIDASEAIDNESLHGGNAGRLRWVYSYAGYYSSTNYYYTNQFGQLYTNTVNLSLAQSPDIDSDSDGKPNNIDPTPFFLTTNLNFTAGNVKATNTMSHQVINAVKVQWTTIPNATNVVYYTTNLFAANWPPSGPMSGSLSNWVAFTNFINSYYWTNTYYGTNIMNSHVPFGNSFISPQVYINSQSLPDNAQQTNVWFYDVMTNVPRYYRVAVWPDVYFVP